MTHNKGLKERVKQGITGLLGVTGNLCNVGNRRSRIPRLEAREFFGTDYAHGDKRTSEWMTCDCDTKN